MESHVIFKVMLCLSSPGPYWLGFLISYTAHKGTEQSSLSVGNLILLRCSETLGKVTSHEAVSVHTTWLTYSGTCKRHEPKIHFFIGTVLSLIKPIINSKDCNPVLSPAGSTKECPNFGTAGKADQRHQTTNDTEI